MAAMMRRMAMGLDGMPKLPLCAALLVCVFGALHAWCRPLYAILLGAAGFGPADRPFVDAEYVLSQIAGYRHGFDVFAANPDDRLGRIMVYPPLWLHLPLPADPAWTGALAAGVLGAFVLGLAVLPRPSGWRQTAVMLAALLSSAVLYALERANVDLLLFGLAALVVLCLDRPWPLRLLGYAVAVLAGLLKLYPFVLLALLLRERPQRAWLTGCAALAAAGAAIWLQRDAFLRMLPHLPQSGFYFDGFGATKLPDGLAFLAALLAPATAAALRAFSLLALLAIGAVLSWRLARSTALDTAMQRMPARAQSCLLVGALLVVGCFLTGVSEPYRLVHALFALSGLLALARAAGDADLARLCRCAAVALVLLMWSPALRLAAQNGVDAVWPGHGEAARFLVWLPREFLWWWLAAVLSAPLLRLALTSPLWLSLLRPVCRSRLRTV